MNYASDILEDDILYGWPDVLQTLLKDHTTKRNIIWATDMYAKDYGEAYSFFNEIAVEQITGPLGKVIRPRAEKSKEEQIQRVKDKAEVFTPAWICNAQNNLIDEAWINNHWSEVISLIAYILLILFFAWATKVSKKEK